MLIRLYGARGSIPVSGRECLTYSGDTTCIKIRSKNREMDCFALTQHSQLRL